MDSKLQYGDIQRVLLERFPELSSKVQESFGSYYDLKTETPDAYPIFEDVLQEYLFSALGSSENERVVARIFSFLEEMANSKDVEVVNLLCIAILKPLVFQPQRVKQAWKYMGDKTKAIAREIAQSEGWQKNLPRGHGTPGNGH